MLIAVHTTHAQGVTWFSLQRLPEPEVMDSDDEVEAYASAAAQALLRNLGS